jgi:hypothetical protein
VTLIAWKNATLLEEAVKLLGLTVEESDDDMANSNPEGIAPELLILKRAMPKIHIDGGGASSGRKNWKSVLNQLEVLFSLFKSGAQGMTFGKRMFPHFEEQVVTWSELVATCQQLKLNQYGATIATIRLFREHTTQAVDLFREEIMDRGYPAAKADVILSTVHAAKGMEWDYVQVLNDMTNFPVIPLKGYGKWKDLTVRVSGVG